MSKWETVKLKDLGDIVTGNTPKTSEEENYNSNDIPFIKPSDFDDEDILMKSTEFYISETARSKARILPVGSIIMTCIGIIGKTMITNRECAFNQQINAIIPNKNVDSRLIAYSLLYKKDILQKHANAAVVPIINKTEFSNIEIFLPPLKAQCQIAENLDKVTHLIDLCNAILEKIDLLVKSRFVEMFGDPVDNPLNWEKKQLQEIVTNDCTISYSIVQTGEPQEEGIPVFRPVDIVNKIPKLEELKKTTFEISNKYKKTLLKGREMLITVRANIADTCIIGKEFKGCNVGRGIVPIRTNEEIVILEFLKYQLDNKHLNDYIKSMVKGITLIQLNMEDLREIAVITPPLILQKKFVEFTRQIDQSKLAMKKILEKSETLKKALMQKYFG